MILVGLYFLVQKFACLSSVSGLRQKSFKIANVPGTRKEFILAKDDKCKYLSKSFHFSRTIIILIKQSSASGIAVTRGRGKEATHSTRLRHDGIELESQKFVFEAKHASPGQLWASVALRGEGLGHFFGGCWAFQYFGIGCGRGIGIGIGIEHSALLTLCGAHSLPQSLSLSLSLALLRQCCLALYQQFLLSVSYRNCSE